MAGDPGVVRPQELPRDGERFKDDRTGSSSSSSSCHVHVREPRARFSFWGADAVTGNGKVMPMGLPWNGAHHDVWLNTQRAANPRRWRGLLTDCRARGRARLFVDEHEHSEDESRARLVVNVNVDDRTGSSSSSCHVHVREPRARFRSGVRTP